MEKLILAFLGLALLSSTASASCNTTGILGYPADPSNQCVEDRGSLGPSDYAFTHSPPCQANFAVLASQVIMNYASNQASQGASDYAGPVAGYVAGLVASSQVQQILGNLHMASTTSACRALCVKLPAGASVVEVRGMARDNESHNGNPTYCQPGHPSHECAVGWSELEAPTYSSTAMGQVVCTAAKNWSGDRSRDFAIFVYYR
jgi:hypothetical protein